MRVRFTVRDLLWLITAVVVGVTVFALPSRSANDPRPITRRTSDQELEAINARYKAAKEEFQFHATGVHGSGRPWSTDHICDVIERFALAAEARDDLEARVKDLAEALEFAQRETAITLDKYLSSVEPADAVYRFQYTRADMEARLRRAEQDLAAAQSTR
jgi:hypothetical protein